MEAKEREAGKLERSEVAEEVGKEEGKLGSGGFVSWWLGGRRWSGTCNHGLEDLFFIFKDSYIHPYSLSLTPVSEAVAKGGVCCEVTKVEKLDGEMASSATLTFISW